MEVKCPVCHMQVESDSMALVYHGMHFAFCSEQCRVRFQATPHLYIGVPGQKAVKQEGREVLKRRCFRLDRSLSDEQSQILVNAITSMMGIKQVVAEETEVHITYDLLEATAEQIEETLLAVGAQLGEEWTERLRRSIVHYTEECETANLEVSDKGRIHHH